MDRSATVGIKIPQTAEQPNGSSSVAIRAPSRSAANDRRMNRHSGGGWNGYSGNGGRGKNRESRTTKRDNGGGGDGRRFLAISDSWTPKPRTNGIGTFNKERFVQANYQFVVAGTEDYGKHLRDPDLPISWELITEVLFTAKTDDHGFGCPICLHYPVAARITRCGHIYCWSCMLHYLSLSDKRSRPCPICFQNVTGGELKSVTIVQKNNYVAASKIRFRLMKIKRGSTLPVPADFRELFEHSFNTKNFDPIMDMFHKIFVASKSQRLALIERERCELTAELVEFRRQKMPEVCFLEAALAELEQTKMALNVAAAETVDEGVVCLLNIKPATEHPEQPDPYTYFYQSEDGQHIYLHSINIRMLKHQYQELKYCPPIIEGRVVELHRQTVTSDLRKRFAHLRHLPLSCEFSIAEVEFDPTVVDHETLKQFQSEIQKRRKERKRREDAQLVRDRNIEIENNRKILNILPPLSDFEITAEDFPVYQLGDDVEGAAPTTAAAWQPVQKISTPLETGGSPSTSFAYMLQAGNLSFDETVRNKKPQPTTNGARMNTDSNDDSDPEAVAPSSLVLSDFFEQCVKISNKKAKVKKNNRK